MDAKGPQFRTAAGKTVTLTRNPMSQPNVYRMIGRRASQGDRADRRAPAVLPCNGQALPPRRFAAQLGLASLLSVLLT